MSKSEETEYVPVEAEDEDYEDVAPRQAPQIDRKRYLLKVILWVEAANLLLLILLFTGWRIAKRTAESELSLDFNTIQTFTVNKTDLRYAEKSAFASQYWLNLTFMNNNGLVTLPISYAKSRNLILSGLPAAAGQTVLQVDVFHQLHCLERIRGVIINTPFLYKLDPNRTEDEVTTKHTLHCVDYLRQALTCQADMTLVSTTNDLEFDRSPPRMCRDFEAVRRWVMRNRYDYNKYLNGIDTDQEKMGD